MEDEDAAMKWADLLSSETIDLSESMADARSK
jgi:hypothetical protein